LQITNSRFQWRPFLLAGGLLLLYLLFPSHNNSGDAWSMAADAKYGHELFSPHHLLYTITLYLFSHASGLQNTLQAGMVLNAIFGALTILVLYFTLCLISADADRNLLLCVVAALSFGFWRYTTENETYIIPVFFSLIGSYYYIKAVSTGNFKNKYLVLSGIFATIGCLYHQIHIFWFLGLLIGWILISKENRETRGLIFSATFGIAILAYFAVIQYYLHQSLSIHNILHFTFHDYYQGSAGNKIGFANLLLGAINFFRTFFQVHGKIWILLDRNLLWYIPGMISLVLIFKVTALVLTASWQNLKHWSALSSSQRPETRDQRLNSPASSSYQRPETRDQRLHSPASSSNQRPETRDQRLHLIIFIMQFAFAVYNIGNAEFMVMLPVLMAILFVNSKIIETETLTYFAIALLVWNFSYGIYANYTLHPNADDKVAQFIADHPDAKFVIVEPAIVFNQYYYQKGEWPPNAWPGPGYYTLHAPEAELASKIDSSLAKGVTVLTDCTGRPDAISRSSFISYPGDNLRFFIKYDLKDTVAAFNTDGGKHVLVKVKKY
jgi:hypothetical protein